MGKVCDKCGSTCVDGALFCKNCGAPLAGKSAADPGKAQPNNQNPAPDYGDRFNQAQNPAGNRQPVNNSGSRPNNSYNSPQYPRQGYGNQPYNQNSRPPYNQNGNPPYNPNGRPPYNQNGNPRQAQPNNTGSKNGVIIAVVISAAVVILAILAVVVLFIFPGILRSPNTPPIDPTYGYSMNIGEAPTTEEITETPTEAPTEKPTEPPTQKPTEKPTEPPTEKPTEPPAEKPVTQDFGNVGEPSTDDFADWFLRASDAGVPGDADLMYSGAQISGNWKGLFYYPMVGVQYMNNIEILAGDRAATVYITSRSVYVDGSFRADNTPMMTLEGAFDSGSLTAYSSSGKLDIFAFYQYGGKQYALGTFTNPSGEVATVGLVRP